MKGFWIGVFITLALIVFVVWLDPEPPPTLSDCVKSHTYVAIVPIYNGKTTTWIPQPRTVCDEWGDPYPNPAHAKWLARQKKRESSKLSQGTGGVSCVSGSAEDRCR